MYHQRYSTEIYEILPNKGKGSTMTSRHKFFCIKRHKYFTEMPYAVVLELENKSVLWRFKSNREKMDRMRKYNIKQAVLDNIHQIVIWNHFPN